MLHLLHREDIDLDLRYAISEPPRVARILLPDQPAFVRADLVRAFTNEHAGQRRVRRDHSVQPHSWPERRRASAHADSVFQRKMDSPDQPDQHGCHCTPLPTLQTDSPTTPDRSAIKPQPDWIKPKAILAHCRQDGFHPLPTMSIWDGSVSRSDPSPGARLTRIRHRFPIAGPRSCERHGFCRSAGRTDSICHDQPGFLQENRIFRHFPEPIGRGWRHPRVRRPRHCAGHRFPGRRMVFRLSRGMPQGYLPQIRQHPGKDPGIRIRLGERQPHPPGRDPDPGADLQQLQP